MNKFAAVTIGLLICVLSPARAERPVEVEMLEGTVDQAAEVIEKAYDMLEATTVFASAYVGDAASPTRGCWALTVIVRYDPTAKEYLTKLAKTGKTPASRLYAIAGLMALDNANRERFSKLGTGRGAGDTAVEHMIGCIFSKTTFAEAVSELVKHGPGLYLFDQLPSVLETWDL